MREDGPPCSLNRDTLPQSNESSQFHGEIPIDSKRIDSVAFPLKLKKDWKIDRSIIDAPIPVITVGRR